MDACAEECADAECACDGAWGTWGFSAVASVVAGALLEEKAAPMAVPARNTSPNITSARNHDERITDVGESLFSLLFLPSRRPGSEDEKRVGDFGESSVPRGKERGEAWASSARGEGPRRAGRSPRAPSAPRNDAARARRRRPRREAAGC